MHINIVIIKVKDKQYKNSPQVNRTSIPVVFHSSGKAEKTKNVLLRWIAVMAVHTNILPNQGGRTQRRTFTRLARSGSYSSLKFRFSLRFSKILKRTEENRSGRSQKQKLQRSATVSAFSLRRARIEKWGKNIYIQQWMEMTAALLGRVGGRSRKVIM